MLYFWNIVKNKRTRSIAQILIFASFYYVAGKFGLSLAFINPSATAVWPPTGIALAGFLLYGYKILPAIFLGAFLVNFTTTGVLPTSLLIAIGNTLEGLVGAYLVSRFASGVNVFDRTPDIFKFTVFIALLSTMISATVGTFTLFQYGQLQQVSFNETWFTWWLGDAGGALVITPLLIFWLRKRSFLMRGARIIEAIFLFYLLIIVTQVVFGNIFIFPYAISYLCIPVLMWIALRRTQTEMVTSMFIIFIIATLNTLHGTGPFAAEGVTINQSLILLQLFLGVVSVMTLVVSAIVTEQRKTAALQDRLATIVNSSNDAIYSMTLQGIVTTWNRGAEKIFGYLAKDMIGKPISRIFPEDKKSELKNIIATVKKGKHIMAYETERMRKGGEVIPVSVAISPLKDNNGNTVEISKIARDISREKELEKRKDEFIGIASHELNTPITGLSIYAQTLEKKFEKKGDKKSLEYLSKMETQISRIRRTIRDLLDISNIRLGLLSFNFSQIDLNVLIKEIAEVTQYMTKKHKILVEGRLEQDILGDRDRIGQVLTNLLSNARKYSPKGGKIIIKVAKHKHEVIVSVQDFGIGIAKSYQKRVFELFYRVHQYHEQSFPGMGIGLFLSFQIIAEHKGRMWFDSKRGKGTTFYFALPLEKDMQHV